MERIRYSHGLYKIERVQGGDALPQTGMSTRELASILDAQVTTTGKEGTGLVTAGHLKIRGKLGHSRWKNSESGIGSLVTLSEFDLIPSVDDTRASRLQTLDCYIQFNDVTDTIERYDSMYCLPLVTFYDAARGHSDYVIGLILTKSASKQFTRIARFEGGSVDAIPQHEAWPEEVLEIV